MAMTANTTFDISFVEDYGVTKRELSSQLSEIKTLKRENSKTRAELLVLRERDASIEVLKEDKRSLQAKAIKAGRLHIEAGTLEAELEALNMEHAKWSVFLHRLLINTLVLFVHSSSSKGNVIPEGTRYSSS